MRIAAGVLLIIAALFNGCVGAGLTILGGAAAVVGEAAEQAAENAPAGSTQVTIPGAQPGEQVTLTTNPEEMAAAAAEAQEAGGLMLIFGGYLVVLFGLEIAAAVLLFIRKAPGFVLVTGILGLVPLGLGLAAGAEITVTWLIPVGISLLAIFSAAGVRRELQGGGSAPAPM